MSFPESKRFIYNQNPLKEVICQLQFPTILEIESGSPAAFQNRIRRDYPLYEKEKAKFPKELAQLLEQLPVGIHKFLTADSERFVSLAPNFLALTEHNYRRWEQFRKELMFAQHSLEEVYQPAFYSRIGLRYINIIDKEQIGLADTPWNELLNAPIIGLLSDNNIRNRVSGIFTEATIQLEEVRGSSANLKHGLGRTENNKEVYLIDIDLFTKERSTNDEVFPILDQFNRIIGNFFRWFIDPRLHAALGPTALD